MTTTSSSLSVLQREVGKYEIRFDDDCAAVAGLTSKIQKLVKFVASGKSCHQPEINYVQPILTYITFYALYLFAREMGFDNTQYPHVHKDSKSEKTLTINGNAQIDCLSNLKPDSFIVLDDDSRIEKPSNICGPVRHLVLVGEAKWKEDIDVARREAFLKSFPSPFFGYLLAYIVINKSVVEIGLFSHLKNDNDGNNGNRNDRAPVICSRTFSVAELGNFDAVNDMLKDLQLLVSIQSAIYKGLLKSEIKMKHSAHTQWDHTAKQQVLTTLVYLVNNFRLDDKDKFWADVPNSAYTEAFKPYFDAVFGVPPNHLFKRALTDSNNIRYNKMVEFRKFCQQLCPKAHAALSTTELLYMIGPIIKREAAGDAYNLPPGQTSTSWTPSATNSPTPAVSTISGKSPFNTKLSTPTPTPTPTPTTTTTTTRNNKQFKAFVSSDHDSYSIIVSAHAGLNDAFEATRPELFTDYTHFEQLFQDIVLCHKLGFAHCDVRRPNIVYHSTTTLGQKMSLVDREYYHSRYTRLSESTATTATATATIAKEEKLAIVDMNTKKVYEHLRTYKYFDFFSRSVDKVRGMEPEPDPRPPRVPDFRWDWDSFRRLDFYNLVRSFFEEHIDKWDNEELEDFKPRMNCARRTKSFEIYHHHCCVLGRGGS
jgi:hypothetical protein